MYQHGVFSRRKLCRRYEYQWKAIFQKLGLQAKPKGAEFKSCFRKATYSNIEFFSILVYFENLKDLLRF